MVIQFKKAVFLNFGHTQTVETLWRMGTQIEQHWTKSTTPEALEQLHNCIDYLKDHANDHLVDLYNELQDYLPIDSQNRLSTFNMKLERITQKELKDPDFLISTEDTLENKGRTFPVTLVLDNLRSAYNVGSLFRTAEALGAEKLILCGLTPTPQNTKTSRTALGSDQWIDWEYSESTQKCLEKLKADGHTLYALETSTSALPIDSIKAQSPSVLILGNERYGIPPHILKLCDQTLFIPMQGRKNSLNVGVCGGIALQALISSL
jgi:tRNA G18 (ribose-2'-O)-methylase SpoU